MRLVAIAALVFVASGPPPLPSALLTKLSPHQTGIADLLATLTFLGKGPKDVLLLGVEPVRPAGVGRAGGDWHHAQGSRLTHLAT